MDLSKEMGRVKLKEYAEFENLVQLVTLIIYYAWSRQTSRLGALRILDS